MSYDPERRAAMPSRAKRRTGYRTDTARYVAEQIAAMRAELPTIAELSGMLDDTADIFPPPPAGQVKP